MVYRPKFVKQWDDPTTTLDWYNCTMASGAMALDFDTLGATQVMGGQLRAVSGDYVGGTNLGVPGLTQAWGHYGEVLHVGSGGHWDDAVAALRQSRGVVLQGWYGALPKAYRSPFNSIDFVGPHAVYVNPESKVVRGVTLWLMGDPLNSKFIWVPESALRAFCEALGKAAPPIGYGPSSPQRIFFASSAAHVPAVAAYTLQIAAGAKVKHWAKPGKCLTDEQVTVWPKHPSTAACGARSGGVKCSGGRATVVHVPDGAFKDRWVWVASPGVKIVQS